jgi:glycosyltransferase involved in cell wall biosynthesis
MRIAQVAPLYESVPPQLYGGTERIVSYLTEELVRRGHEVTLFASGDSHTRARLVSNCEQALRLSGRCNDPLVAHYGLLERVFEDVSRFDVIHFHCDYLHFPFSRRHGCPQVTTLHGRLDLPELPDLYREYSDMPVVAISDAQRQPVRHANWQAVIHHGLPPDLYSFGEGKQGYLAFLGRIAREKRPDRAIRIAMRTGIKLKIAAKVDRADEEYYEKEIRPLLDEAGDAVEFIGEVGDRDKQAFLGDALALLFPIDWPEPFGLVMIESMACGTPVIAFRNGSVPEVVDEGVTGYLVESEDEAVDAVRRVGFLSRETCRETFDRRFTAARMAEDYLRVYRQQLLGREEMAGMAAYLSGGWQRLLRRRAVEGRMTPPSSNGTAETAKTL